MNMVATYKNKYKQIIRKYTKINTMYNKLGLQNATEMANTIR